MATIERKPLPPPNSSATSITEADRAEMMAQANAVIDYYLNGPGSYLDAGPRKPLVGDERDDSTVNDLKKFKERVIASKQYADDPNSIMDSVIDVIDRAMMQVKKVAQSRFGGDDIQRAPPSTNDRIEYPKQLPGIPYSTLRLFLWGEDLRPQIPRISASWVVLGRMARAWIPIRLSSQVCSSRKPPSRSALSGSSHSCHNDLVKLQTAGSIH
jgi:hypothetical protein